MNTLEVNMFEVNTLEVNTLEVNTLEVNTLEVNTFEVNMLEVKTLEVNTLEVNTLEVNTLEVNTLEGMLGQTFHCAMRKNYKSSLSKSKLVKMDVVKHAAWERNLQTFELLNKLFSSSTWPMPLIFIRLELDTEKAFFKCNSAGF